MHDFVVEPTAFDVVVVEGIDAERFLQGQLTCNLQTLQENNSTLGACCDNKGRVLSAFILARHLGSFYLCMAKGSGELLVSALKKFVPFYKCSMSMNKGDFQLYGLAGAAALQARSSIITNEHVSDGSLLQLSGDTKSWLCWLGGTTPRALLWGKLTPAPVDTLGKLEDWETLGLLQGHYPFRPEDSGKFTPQELNLDQNGYVSFNKGCYTGQEIVARMHYRGKHKKQLYLLSLAGQPVGTGISSFSSSATGVVLLTRSQKGKFLALAQLPSEFSDPFASLTCGGTPVLKGCVFDQTVIQSATLL